MEDQTHMTIFHFMVELASLTINLPTCKKLKTKPHYLNIIEHHVNVIKMEESHMHIHMNGYTVM